MGIRIPLIGDFFQAESIWNRARVGSVTRITPNAYEAESEFFAPITIIFYKVLDKQIPSQSAVNRTGQLQGALKVETEQVIR